MSLPLSLAFLPRSLLANGNTNLIYTYPGMTKTMRSKTGKQFKLHVKEGQFADSEILVLLGKWALVAVEVPSFRGVAYVFPGVFLGSCIRTIKDRLAVRDNTTDGRRDVWKSIVVFVHCWSSNLVQRRRCFGSVTCCSMSHVRVFTPTCVERGIVRLCCLRNQR